MKGGLSVGLMRKLMHELQQFGQQRKSRIEGGGRGKKTNRLQYMSGHQAVMPEEV